MARCTSSVLSNRTLVVWPGTRRAAGRRLRSRRRCGRAADRERLGGIAEGRRAAAYRPRSMRRATGHAPGRINLIGEHTDYNEGLVLTVALRGRGVALGGFDAEITSTLPLGAGLGSSAALAVAFVRALRGLFELALDDAEIAAVAHTA